MRTLQAGGTAADACGPVAVRVREKAMEGPKPTLFVGAGVAAAAALNVTEPCNTGIGAGFPWPKQGLQRQS
jgi:gamma-glutamyltranspeptidase